MTESLGRQHQTRPVGDLLVTRIDDPTKLRDCSECDARGPILVSFSDSSVSIILTGYRLQTLWHLPNHGPFPEAGETLCAQLGVRIAGEMSETSKWS